MIGSTISHYKIVSELGRGGMGIVYKAEDLNLERLVAIKVLPPQIVDSEIEAARFRREAKAAAALNHSNIATIYDFGQTDEGQMYIVMEFVRGETLSDRIKRNSVTVDEAVRMAIEIAQGLGAAHTAGVVHRDVKPSNIIVTDEGHAKILDFGLSKMAGAVDLTKSRSTIGTAAYMSPEQARGEDAGKEADIWSLGVVLYELLTGKRPFTGEYEAAIAYGILNTVPKTVFGVNPDVSSELSSIAMRALEKDATERYASMEDFIGELESYQAPVTTTSATRTFAPWKDSRVVFPLAVAVIAIVSLLYYQNNKRERVLWAHQVGIPGIERLAELQQYRDAYDLAVEVETIIPNDTTLVALWPRFSGLLSVHSDPSEADVYIRPYTDLGAEWTEIGRTPIDSLLIPIEYWRVRLVKPGFETIELQPRTMSVNVELRETGSEFSNMILIPEVTESTYNLLPVGLDHLGREPFSAFLIDRHEVSNREFRGFVAAGGYENPEFWKYPFLLDGRPVSWEDGMRRFVDRTGRPGPSTWEVQDYPEDKDDYPVTGLSWYEAAAYAEFVEKELPTVFHWARAAYIRGSALIVPLSNLNGSGPSSRGEYQGTSRYGVFDLAGNAREWVFNGTGNGEERYLLGGGWNDPDYGFTDTFAISAWDRSGTNGFRCAVYTEPNDNQQTLIRSLPPSYRDYDTEEPVGDAEFAAILRQYKYDRTSLNARIEETDDRSEGWRREKVTFDPAYDGDRMIAIVFLPERGTPPYQTVVFFPGSGVIHRGNSASITPRSQMAVGEFILKSGRAFVFPIYTSTYERSDDITSDYGDESIYYKDRVIRRAQDLRRTIEYLETRDDIDASSLAYYGFSWGAASGPIMTVVEPRFKASIYLVAGLYPSAVLPEADPFNFLSRVTVPTLMLNGRYDYFFPHESSQRPLYERLGTAEGHKYFYLSEGGHSVPRDSLITLSLDWLDKYLGPVK